MDSFSKYLRNNFKEIDISSAIADYKGELDKRDEQYLP